MEFDSSPKETCSVCKKTRTYCTTLKCHHIYCIDCAPCCWTNRECPSCPLCAVETVVPPDPKETEAVLHPLESPETTKKIETSRNECSICLFEMNNRAVIDGCLHNFCLDCIKDWVKKSNMCPLCRAFFWEVHHSIKSSTEFETCVIRVELSENHGTTIGDMIYFGRFAFPISSVIHRRAERLRESARTSVAADAYSGIRRLLRNLPGSGRIRAAIGSRVRRIPEEEEEGGNVESEVNHGAELDQPGELLRLEGDIGSRANLVGGAASNRLRNVGSYARSAVRSIFKRRGQPANADGLQAEVATNLDSDRSAGETPSDGVGRRPNVVGIEQEEDEEELVRARSLRWRLVTGCIRPE